LRQWFRNNSRFTSHTSLKTQSKNQTKIQARHLAAKQYAQQIKEIATELRAEDQQLNAMTAFNRGTTIFLSELVQKDPTAYQKLQSDAQEIRNHPSVDYTDMTQDALIA
jgi:hypothetical protein